jgi:divalent metal cation (Fe/Co/Zn/Cd) transporter
MSRIVVSLRTARKYRSRVSLSLHLKTDADVAIGEAHDVAERVEAQLREEPGVDDVHTHLEPLEQPVAARPDEDPAAPDDCSASASPSS